MKDQPEMTQQTWHGDWEARIIGRVQERGAATVTEYTDRYPQATFLELAQQLRPGVAAIQIRSLLFDEAVRSGTFSHYAASSLVREIRRELPHGWGRGANPAFRAASAFGTWATNLGEDNLELAREVWNRLKNEPKLEGWLPGDSSDPVLVAVLGDLNWSLPVSGSTEERPN
jgi:hypothetical protein